MDSQLYVFLGAEGSERFALLANLLETGSRILVHVDELEFAKSKGVPEESLVPWKWIDDRIAIGGDITLGSELFFTAHGRQSPVDFVEGLRD